MKYVAPSVAETAFNCSHCGALAKQFWFDAYAKPKGEKDLPRIWNSQTIEDFNVDISGAAKDRELGEYVKRAATGVPFFEVFEKWTDRHLINLWISQCYNCDELSIWLYDRLVYPQKGEAPPANPDLPTDIRRDYDEASSILDLSPRGAAALVRLGIQKLCKELGQEGKNINADIKALVAGGLDPRVQKALDTVRDLYILARLTFEMTVLRLRAFLN